MKTPKILRKKLFDKFPNIFDKFEFKEIVKGWGIYKNKKVIVTSVNDIYSIDFKTYILNKKNLTQVQIKKVNELDNIFLNFKIGSYSFYDPETFIMVYTHNVTYLKAIFSNNNKEVSTILRSEVISELVR